ncbi:MAG: cohesin domain-containing protein [Patescibacteria group bacterium]
MKKLLIALVMVGVVGLAGNAYAATATINLAPASRTVTTGQTFTVTVSVAPSGGSATTVKTKLTFSPAILQVTGFTFAQNWLPLTQSGYDVTDNAGGSLVKTAGFPGGVNTTKTFGTVTFRAKAAGTATIKVDSSSMALDSVNNNIFTGGNQVTVTVRAPAPASATPTAGATGTGTGTSPSGTPNAVASPEASPEAQAAAIFLGLSSRSWWIIGIIVLAALILWGLSRRRRA